MPVGRALCVGVSRLDPQRIGRSFSGLPGCDADALAMKELLIGKSFITPKCLRSPEATLEAFQSELRTAACQCEPGDLFVLTFSGHGAQRPFVGEPEPDGKDEYWCLHDFAIVDNDIRALLGEFRAGVRILVISDSCHSGTVTSLRSQFLGLRRDDTSLLPRSYYARMKQPPEDAWNQHLTDNFAHYHPGLVRARAALESINPSVLLMSACLDDEETLSGIPNGEYTTALLSVCKQTPAPKTYLEFVRRIADSPPSPRTASIDRSGVKDDPAAIPFVMQRPFSI